MNTFDQLKVQCLAFVKLRMECNRLDQVRNNAHDLLQMAEQHFGKDLKRWVSREAQRVVDSWADCRCINVRVHCLVNHRDNTGKAFVTIQWAGLFGRFDFEGLVTDRAGLRRLLQRFERTVRVNSAKRK